MVRRSGSLYPLRELCPAAEGAARQPAPTLTTSLIHLVLVNSIIAAEFDFKVDGYDQTIVWAKPC